MAAELGMTVEAIRELEQRPVPIGYRIFMAYLRVLRLDPAEQKWMMIAAWLRDECPGPAAVSDALGEDRRAHVEDRRERSLSLVENAQRPSGDVLDMRAEVLAIARRQSNDISDRRRAHMLWVVRATDRQNSAGADQADRP